MGARALFLPSHVGLGHVARDYVIAGLLRSLAGVEVEWCTAEPALGFLRALGERVASGCEGLESFSAVIEDLYNGRVRGLRDLASRLEVLRRNYEAVRGLVEDGGYDLVFADEFWEVVYAAPEEVKGRVVFATDFVYKPYSLNPLESIVSVALNRYFKRVLPSFARLIFLNDPDTVRGRRWYGIAGGRVDEWLERHAVIAGLATSYAPGEVPPRTEARRRLGLGEDELVVVVTVGGTSARSLHILDCIDRAAPSIVEALEADARARVRIVVIPGPRTRFKPRRGVVEVVDGAVPRLLDYYSAGDVFIARAGRTTTADLLCQGRPAVLIPIKGHFEQEEIAKHMSRRHSYPVLRESQCSPQALARALRRALRLKPKPPYQLCRGNEAVAGALARSLAGSTQA